VLQQAWSHVVAALQGNSGGELHLLAGRIAMEQGNLDEALAQFDQSAQAGMDAVQLAPYRAEIAFLRQRYEEIPDMLATMPAELLQRPPFAALARYWL
jgi:polysaccharide biosynthesis protein PelE